MNYKIEKIPEGGELYINRERTGIWEGKPGGGDYTVTIYSHPGSKYAWSELYRTNQGDKARDAAMLWAKDAVKPVGRPIAADPAETGKDSLRRTPSGPCCWISARHTTSR